MLAPGYGCIGVHIDAQGLLVHVGPRILHLLGARQHLGNDLRVTVGEQPHATLEYKGAQGSRAGNL